MRNRYSHSEEGRNNSNRLDIRELQRNVKKMKRQVESVMRKQKQSPSPRAELPPLISESKLIRCCDDSTPRSLTKSYEAIDRLLKWSVEKRNHLCEMKGKKDKGEENLSMHKKPNNYANQIKLKNSVKKIRQEMNLYHSQFVSLRASSKILKKQELVIHSRKDNAGKPQNQAINHSIDKNSNNQTPHLSQELSVKKLRKKNSRSRKKHSKKFSYILDLINRKVDDSSEKNQSKIQMLLQKRSARRRSRIRCYSESNCEGLSNLQNVLMEHSKPYKSILIDSRLEMLKKQKEINRKKIVLEPKIHIKSEPMNNYMDMEKYVVILDKNKSILRKVKPPPKINPIGHNISPMRKKKTARKDNEHKEIDLDFSPWDNKNTCEVDFEDNLRIAIQNGSTQISNQY